MTAKYNLGDKNTATNLEDLLRGFAKMAWETEYPSEYHDLVARTRTEEYATNYMIATVQSPLYGSPDQRRGTKEETLHLLDRGVVIGWSEVVTFKVQIALPYIHGCRCKSLVDGYSAVTRDLVTSALRRELNSLPESESDDERKLNGRVNGNMATVTEAVCLFCL